MKVPRFTAAATAAFILTFFVVLLPTADAAQSAGPVLCGMSARSIQEYGVLSRPNPFGLAGTNAANRFCAQANNWRPGFRILNSLPFTGRVMGYPFTGVGCAYYLCSHGTNLPKQLWTLSRRINSSWTWRGSTNGEWNASYDLWFDTRNQISTQDNGAELMIWLRTMPGYPAGRSVFIAGHWMRLMSWRTGHNGIYWNYIQFRFARTTHSVRRLSLWPFIRYAIRHGLIRRSWYLTSIHAGYELWSGGKGLSTTWFNAHT
jgi:endoglucanase